jgi:outer membrane immunogenic protein
VLIGLEGTLAWSGIKASTQFTAGKNADPHTVSTDLRWFGTIAPRLGYAFDRALIFVTGGFAWGDFRYGHTHDMVQKNVLHSFSASNTRTGWMIGGGVEYAFTDHIIGRAEYDYMDFGSHNETLTEAGTSNSVIFRTKDRVNLVKVGVSYKF